MIIGTCLRCGACCKEAARFNYWGKKYPVCEDNGPTKVEILPLDPTMKPCRELSFGPDGKAICGLQNEKPYICKGWPFFKEELIFPSCGYKWIDEATL